MQDWGWLLLIMLGLVLISKMKTGLVLANNEERWEYTDFRGNVRKVIVYRHATEG